MWKDKHHICFTLKKLKKAEFGKFSTGFSFYGFKGTLSQPPKATTSFMNDSTEKTAISKKGKIPQKSKKSEGNSSLFTGLCRMIQQQRLLVFAILLVLTHSKQPFQVTANGIEDHSHL